MKPWAVAPNLQTQQGTIKPKTPKLSSLQALSNKTEAVNVFITEVQEVPEEGANNRLGIGRVVTEQPSWERLKCAFDFKARRSTSKAQKISTSASGLGDSRFGV